MPFIDRDGIRLYYETHGTGRPLLFLSETACHCDVWKLHQVPAFSRDHQVILCDYRGTGRSDWPSEPYNVKDFADDAAAVLEHLDARDAVVCGHSMGGSVAQVMALDHSDRVSALICASGRGFNPHQGIPLRIAKEMVEWGYERYLRDHGILVGFTEDFVKRYPQRGGRLPGGPDGASQSGGAVFSPRHRAPAVRRQGTAEGDPHADPDPGG